MANISTEPRSLCLVIILGVSSEILKALNKEWTGIEGISSSAPSSLRLTT